MQDLVFIVAVTLMIGFSLGYFICFAVYKPIIDELRDTLEQSKNNSFELLDTISKLYKAIGRR